MTKTTISSVKTVKFYEHFNSNKKDLSKSEENVTIKEKKQTERELSIPKGKH